MPEVYAGVAQEGAAAASHQVLLDIELMTLEGVPYCGGAADIQKFFGHIVRQLVYHSLRITGMPLSMILTNRRFSEQMLTYNIVAGGIGNGSQRRCGIPQ